MCYFFYFILACDRQFILEKKQIGLVEMVFTLLKTKKRRLLFQEADVLEKRNPFFIWRRKPLVFPESRLL